MLYYIRLYHIASYHTIHYNIFSYCIPLCATSRTPRERGDWVSFKGGEAHVDEILKVLIIYLSYY